MTAPRKTKERDEVGDVGDAAEDAERHADAEQELDAAAQAEAELEQDQSLVPALVEKVEYERDLTPVVSSTLPSVAEWDAMNALASRIATTEFVPRDLRGRPEAVVACILAGREIGIGPMQALKQIHIIDGRPAFAADLMLAKMRAGGIKILESESTPQRAYIKAQRMDTGEIGDAEWTIEEATQAKLIGKKNWEQYPQDMLWARTVGRLARRLGSDMFGGMVYSAEEVQDFDDDWGGGYGDQNPGYTTDPSKSGSSSYFNPGRDLLPGAPKGWKEINGTLNGVDPTLEWTDLASAVALATVGVGSVKEMDDEQARAFGFRLANAAQKLADLMTEGSFPPPSPIDVMSAFEWAFELPEGHAVEPTYKGTVEDEGGGESESAEDVPPPGEEGQAALDVGDEPKPRSRRRKTTEEA